MKDELRMVMVVALGLFGCLFLITSCERTAELERTKRQFIAGTNVLERPWSF